MVEYNRQKYIDNEFDHTDATQIKIYQKILSENLKGLDWNLFIKDYVIRDLREDLMDLNFSTNRELQAVALQIVPMLILGMFKTLGAYVSTISFSDENLLKFKEKWVPLFLSADDIDE